MRHIGIRYLATLGRIIDQATETWFEPSEKISKLLIAILYEDDKEGTKEPPEAAADELTEIKTLLNLRGEKSKEQGMFEEVE